MDALRKTAAWLTLLLIFVGFVGLMVFACGWQFTAILGAAFLALLVISLVLTWALNEALS